jgi:hypothetical protein
MAKDQTPEGTITFFKAGDTTKGVFFREQFDGAVAQLTTDVICNSMRTHNLMAVPRTFNPRVHSLERNEVDLFDSQSFSCQHAMMLVHSFLAGGREIQRVATVQQEICAKFENTRPWAALGMTPYQFAFESQVFSLKQRAGLAIDAELPLVRALLAANAVVRVALTTQLPLAWRFA